MIVIGDDERKRMKSGPSAVEDPAWGMISLRAKARSSALVPEVRHTRLEARRFANI